MDAGSGAEVADACIKYLQILPLWGSRGSRSLVVAMSNVGFHQEALSEGDARFFAKVAIVSVGVRYHAERHGPGQRMSRRHCSEEVRGPTLAIQLPWRRT